ncbi:recombinase family protein [Roseburia sp. MSJ-14]|uniref:recombinase family protein n=1 Tax=Roseburia sp. MSJ-14 TaxID=2841514 RepID=UPI001C1128AB|nr:recombinase family protein [Roseburia sp. MSJ-14]MBU5473570.1 recombinase family protein [Roseburia sp. MSJ-14]
MKLKFVVAIYARKSVILKKGDTLNTQEDKCRKLAEYYYGDEYELSTKCYTDEKSGKDMDREQMQKMIASIKDRKIQAVFVYKLDRLGRNATDLLNFIELLKEYKVKLHCVEDKVDYDPADENDIMTRFLIMFLSLMAEMERNNIRQRIIATKDSLSRRGFWLGGTAPYGFESVKVPNNGIISGVDAKYLYILSPIQKEMEMIEYIFKTYQDEKLSYGALADKCNDLGYKPRWAKMFDQHTIQDMLMNMAYVKATKEVYDWLISRGFSKDNIPERELFDGKHALLTYGKTTGDSKREDAPIDEWIVAIAPHEGIIEGKDWLKVQKKILKNSGKKNKKNTKHNNVLITSDMFVCGCCGGTISSYNRKSRKDKEVHYPHYRCENKRKRKGHLCNVENISATEVDEKIIDALFDRKEKILGSINYVKEHLLSAKGKNTRTNIIPKLEKEIKEQQKKIDNLVENMATGLLSKEVIERINTSIRECNDRIEELKESIAKENKKLANIEEQHKNLDLIVERLLNLSKEDFKNLSMDKKRELISILIKKVVWDGEQVHVYFNVPDEVCGDDATDFLFNETALTCVDMVKPHF